MESANGLVIQDLTLVGVPDKAVNNHQIWCWCCGQIDSRILDECCVMLLCVNTL